MDLCSTREGKIIVLMCEINTVEARSSYNTLLLTNIMMGYELQEA